MYSFEYPYVFLLLLVFVICAFTCKPQKPYMYMPNFTNISLSVKKNYLKEAIKWLSLILLITSLASPISKKNEVATKPAHAVMLLMDVSDSMSQGGILVNALGAVASKLSVAKSMASDYIKQRVNDHVGVIVFGDFAYVASPLSFDHNSVAKLLETVNAGVAGKRTAMYDALFLSARLLKNSPAKQKVAILLTDGFNTAGDIPYSVALRAVESEKMKVYTIGIGNYGDYDERALKEIAQKSHGEFFRATDASSLKNIYEQIDKLEKSKLKDKPKYKKTYLYMYPLGVAFFLFFVYTLLHVRRREV